MLHFSAVHMTIGFAKNSVIVSREADLSAALTVRILNGSLAPGLWTIVEFRTSDVPSSAVCKYSEFTVYMKL